MNEFREVDGWSFMFDATSWNKALGRLREALRHGLGAVWTSRLSASVMVTAILALPACSIVRTSEEDPGCVLDSTGSPSDTLKVVRASGQLSADARLVRVTAQLNGRRAGDVQYSIGNVIVSGADRRPQWAMLAGGAGAAPQAIGQRVVNGSFTIERDVVLRACRGARPLPTSNLSGVMELNVLLGQDFSERVLINFTVR